MKTHSIGNKVPKLVDNPDKAAEKYARMTGGLNSVKDNDTISDTTGSVKSSRAGTPLSGKDSM